MILVDSNVLSEPTKPAPSGNVIRWLQANESSLVTSPVILGEIEYGILVLPAGRRRSGMQSWFEKLAKAIEVIDFDNHTGSAWAKLLADLKRKGKAMPVKDSLIAATAIAHGLPLATRNLPDFKHTGIRLIDPFHAA